MAVTKSNYVAVIAGTEYKLDCAPFPRTENKLQANLTVNGTSVKSAVSRSKTEVYYTYFLWEGKSYSFQRGVLITPETGEITLNPVAGKPVATPKTVATPVVAEAPAPVAEEPVVAEAPKPKKARTPKKSS